MLAEKCHFWSKSNLPVRNTIHKRFRPFQPPLARYLQCHWSWRFTVWITKAVGLQGHHWLKCSEIWWNLYAKFRRSMFKVGSFTAKRQLKSKINLSTCIKCLLILVQSLYFQSANLRSTNGIRTGQTSQAYLSVLLWPWRSCCQEFRVTCRWTSMTLSKRFRCLKNIVIGVVVVVMVGGIAHLVAAFRVHLRNREEGISGAKKKERKARYITTVCLAPWHATAEPGRWGSAPHRNSRRPVKLEDLSGKMWQVISGLKMLQAGMHLHWSFCGFLTVPPQNLAMRSWRGDKSCYPKIWRPARPRNACWNRWTRCQADSTWEWRAPIGTPLPLKPQNASKCPTLSWCDASCVQCPCVIREVSLPTQTQRARRSPPLFTTWSIAMQNQKLGKEQCHF